MDFTFQCPKCRQEMVVDSSGAGTEVDCPACGSTILIPKPDVTNFHTLNPIAGSAAAREEHHYAVPVHETPSEVLIKKPNIPLEAAAKGADKSVHIKSIKRTDCVEVGKDLFDQRVSEFLAHVGEANIVSINAINYTHLDISTRQLMVDYGVMIIYKG